MKKSHEIFMKTFHESFMKKFHENFMKNFHKKGKNESVKTAGPKKNKMTRSPPTHNPRT